MELIDKYNGLGSMLNDLNFEELGNICGIDFEDLNYNILHDRVFDLYDIFEDKLRNGDEEEKLNAKYSIAFLIVLFSVNSQKQDVGGI